MLTCKVGEKIINCFDNKYDKHTLKNWSSKNILKCPDCGKPYEYCHGEVVLPYFRHKEKNRECEGIYSEPESVEHINGKLILYNWLLKMQNENIIQNLKLEAYIPETKQRPDIYFEKENERYVIEFQCTPIATEYLERHELYKLANINDIWIMGVNNYNIKISEDGKILRKNRSKFIEKHSNFYLDVNSSKLCFCSKAITDELPYGNISYANYISMDINDFVILKDKLKLNEAKIKEIINKDIEMQNEALKKQKEKEEEISKQKMIVDAFNTFFKTEEKPYDFKYRSENKLYYNWGVEFNSTDHCYIFFIKDTCVDCCIPYVYSAPYFAYSHKKHRNTKRWGRFTGYKNVEKLESNTLNEKDIINFVTKIISPIVTKYDNKIECLNKEKEKFKKTCSEFLNKEILLINAGGRKVSEDIRFKFLRDFSTDIKYMSETFVKELKFLDKKGVDKFIFMIPKYDSINKNFGIDGYLSLDKINEKVINHFKSYGFKNIKYLDY